MTGVFETQTLRVCPTEQIICVKEFAKYSFCSPKFFATQKTFLNAYSTKFKGVAPRLK